MIAAGMPDGWLILRPLWLLALPLFLVMAAGIWRRRAAGEWAGVIDPALMPVLRRLRLFSDARGDPTAILPLAGAALVALALSGPAQLRPGAVEYRVLDPLILAVDMSPSVVADERVLTGAKAAAMGLLDRAAGRPVGLMLYSADAWLAFAPTSDAQSLQGLIGVLGRDTVPVAGSRPDIALSMARDLFGGRQGPGLGGADLVLITDGGGAGPRAVEEAARLASDGARVWALTLPDSAEGAPLPQPDAMVALARAGGGAAVSADDVADLSDRIAAARTLRLARDEVGGQGTRDFGPWLLPLALAALFPLYRRRR